MATRDIPFEGGETSDMPGFRGVIEKGTVARRRMSGHRGSTIGPSYRFHEIYTMDTFDAIEPQEDWPQHYHYRIVIEGDSSTELILQGAPRIPTAATPGPRWVPPTPFRLVDAPPGFMSHNELGLMPLRGVIRP